MRQTWVRAVSGTALAVGALLLLVSVAALGRKWRAVAAVAFGLTVAVKFLPIVLAPLYWRRLRIRSVRGRAAGATLLFTNWGNTKIRLLRGIEVGAAA